MSNLVDFINSPKLSNKDIRKLKNLILSAQLKQYIVEIYVTSTDFIKINSVERAVGHWLKGVFGDFVNWKILAKGYECASYVPKQPFGAEIIATGAQNRLNNLILELMRHVPSFEVQDNILRIMVSLENGLMKMRFDGINDSEIFANNDGTVYVDIAFIDIDIWFNGSFWQVKSDSQGVLTPKHAVELSERSDWKKTVGYYIGKKYKCDPKDWYSIIADKSRKLIIEDGIKHALGTIY